MHSRKEAVHEAPPNIDAVADGILRIRMPVPFGRLGDVNVYLLREGAGWAVIDTGLNTPAARTTWEAALAEAGIAFADVRRIVLTHSHPDHAGCAGWLQRRVEAAGGAAPVYVTRRERELARYWAADGTSEAPLRQLFGRCGVPEALLATAAADLQALRQATQPHPRDVRTLPFDRPFPIGTRTFAVIHTPGHSDGHAVLYDADDRLLLAGDHVLPHITPTISRWPSTEPNPLGRYLQSLRAVRALDVRRALPGHGTAIDDWAARIEAIEAHHAARLAHMHRIVAAGAATVFDVAREAFAFDTLDAGETRFAIAETLAHLDYLVAEGRLRRRDTPVWHFEPMTSAHTTTV